MSKRFLHTWDDTEPMRRTLPHDVAFVFGSNLRGAHGKGAAEFAVKYFGACYGIGEGYYGQSYGIPTKDHQIQVLPVDDIARAVKRFIEFAKMHDRLKFFITAIGCGLAGYTPPEIAPLFEGIPSNCAIPASWAQYFPGTTFIESGV